MFIEIPYEIVLQIHITAFVLSVVVVVYSDIQAFRWLRGWKRTLSATVMRRLHYVVWASLSTSVVTGVVLAAPLIEYLRTVPAFYVKLSFVMVLILNAGVIGKHIAIASQSAYQDVSTREKRVLIASGLVSSGSWVMVFLAAQFLGL